ANDVINILLRHGVEVLRTTEAMKVKNAIDFRTGKPGDKSFPAGSILVTTKQPQHLFITTLMERNMAIEDSVMYDMSTWSAPLAYNLDAYSLTSAPFVGTEEITKEQTAKNGFNKASEAYAYVINWNQRHAPKALAKLWEKKYRVRSSDAAFTDQNGKTYPPGTLIVLAGRNLEKKDVIEDDLEMIAKSTGVVIDSYQSGRMKTGMDLASSKNRPVKQPKVAMLVEPPFNTYTCGQIYFLFDQETELPVERVRASVLQQTALPKFGSRYGLADINNYDVLILAGGGNALKQLFPKEQLAVLKDWVSRGGTIVATESAANFFTKKASGFTNVEIKASKRDTSEQANYVTYEDRQDYFGKKRIPGTALNAVIDDSHPLAFGVDPTVYSLKFGTDAYVPSTAFQTVGHYHKDADQLAVAGYASTENLKHLAGGAFAGVANVGRGKVVFLLDNAHYRMFWRGPSRMMQNAVMLMPGF
ncbi:MAG: peptidase M14, partial [Bacteroidota bacterium]